MKESLSSLDVRILARELDAMLKGARVDRTYQISEKEVKVKLHVPEKGSTELVIAPNYICVSRYTRPAPETPSGFAMSMRKHTKGGFIRSVVQHEFDRIIEFEIERKEKKFRLIAELFSKGNVILTGGEGKIVTLLEWQRWKDRKLGVHQVYEYPPATANPFSMDEAKFREHLLSTKKKVVSAIAADASFGGPVAEEICARAKVKKDANVADLTDGEYARLFEATINLTNEAFLDPQYFLVKEGEKNEDLIPYVTDALKGTESETHKTFNEAVDEFFSDKEIKAAERAGAAAHDSKLKKLKKIEAEQRKTIEDLKKKSVTYRETGDALYQHMNELEPLMAQVRELRKEGMKDADIVKEIPKLKSLKGNEAIFEI